MKKKELIEKLKALDLKDEKIVKKVTCSLIGHSNIQTTYFGYHYCGRCNDQVGDSLGSIYSNDKQVIIGHNCKTCYSNYKKLTWKDKFKVQNPFKQLIGED